MSISEAIVEVSCDRGACLEVLESYAEVLAQTLARHSWIVDGAEHYCSRRCLDLVRRREREEAKRQQEMAEGRKRSHRRVPDALSQHRSTLMALHRQVGDTPGGREP